MRIWRKDLGHTSFLTLLMSTSVYVHVDMCIYMCKYIKRYVYIYILLVSLKLPSVIPFHSTSKAISDLRNTAAIELEKGLSREVSGLTISRGAGASAASSVGQKPIFALTGLILCPVRVQSLDFYLIINSAANPLK